MENQKPTRRPGRADAAFLLSGLFLFFLCALVLISGVSWTPMAPRIGYVLKAADFLLLLAALAVFLPAFVYWAKRHMAHRRLGEFRFPVFLAQLALLYAVTAAGAWAWSFAAVNPMVKLFALGTLALLLFPVMQGMAGFIMRVVFFWLFRTAMPSAEPRDPVAQYAIPSYTPVEDFYPRALQCLNQARRFDLQLGILLIAFDRGQLAQAPDHPAIERPLLHQVLFLLTELNRQYEPWTFLEGRGVFVNALLLSGPHHVGPVCDRFARILRDRARDRAGQPIAFRILAARRAPGRPSTASAEDGELLRQWVAQLLDELGPQKEAVRIRADEG